MTLAVALFAAAIAIYTWLITHSKTKYAIADTMLTDFTKISLEKPRLRDPEHCKSALKHSDVEIRLEYDAFATLA